jgi:hypothetical protein
MDGSAIKAENRQADVAAPTDLPAYRMRRLDPVLHYGDQPRSEAQARAEAAVNKLRKPAPVSACAVNVDWCWPGSDSKLVLEVDHDRFGNRTLVDVLDAQGHQFPFEAIELNGKSLEDVLVDYVRWLPELEG